MPAAVDISVIGDKALAKTLADLPDALQKSIVRKAMRPAGNFLLKEVKAATPVKTGALKKNLKLRAIKRSRSRFGVMIPLPTRESLGIDAKTDGYYPAVLEYGSPARNIAPRAYIRGTTNKNETRWRAKVGQGIRDIMEDEIKKNNQKAAARRAKAMSSG